MTSTEAAGRYTVFDRVPAHAFFVLSAVFHYLGPAFAVLLFSRVEPLGVAWLRIISAAAIFWVWRRPWRIWCGLGATARRLLLGWAAVLAAMNATFYVAIDRLPLGTVAAVEFAPVILLAALALRTMRNGIALVLAVGGVYLLTEVQLATNLLGLICAGVNAVLFAGYIVLGHRVSRNRTLRGIDALALAMGIAALLALPFGIAAAGPALADPRLLAAAAGVGVCSSVIPYVSDQLAMARLSRGTYALMLSLLPATAAVIGALVLGQWPAWLEVLGIALVVAAMGVHRRELSR
ncbi:MAG TPA: EamA family transporter [Kribbellaceae bacterium]|nr:EamA family transporter [Kribbellaceae bacterium]